MLCLEWNLDAPPVVLGLCRMFHDEDVFAL